MRTRRISLVPSKIMLIRESRSAFSYGYSSMKPLPPAIWSASLIVDPDGLGAEDLAARALERVVLEPAVDQPGRQVHHRLERVRRDDHPGELGPDHLEVGDPRPELLALRRVEGGLADHALGAADAAGAERRAAGVQDLDRDPEALAPLARGR